IVSPHPMTIDLIVGERRSQVSLVPRLSADFSFSLSSRLGLFLGRLDEVAGRRLGGIARVLASGGKLRLQRGEVRLERSDACFQVRTSRAIVLGIRIGHNVRY